jgi:acyl dehydratase
MPVTFDTPRALLGTEGTKLGETEWVAITQDRINRFADATDDHQWIHVDAERAKTGPFGKTIAHGYLTLSLVSRFLPQLLTVNGAKMGVNYGCDRVRFPSPVREGARIRGTGEVVKVEEVSGGGVQITVRVTVEIEGEAKPACVVDSISRWYSLFALRDAVGCASTGSSRCRACTDTPSRRTGRRASAADCRGPTAWWPGTPWGRSSGCHRSRTARSC